MPLRTFVVYIRGPGSDAICSKVTDHFKDFAVILHCIIVIDRSILVLLRLGVIVFGNGDGFLEIESVEMKLDVGIVKKVVCHGCAYFNLFLNTSMNRGITSVASPTMP